ncbi:hypothetical protein PYCCODRAFT_351133 [Trametes coccinea BRFM310]|uniref:Uncharacterized protein n=1 Tax=Trametes coccinea (strain BRFM310) TaxID=1353009 RepID=A0A1Y2J4P7_TRAC3|nr:hypothetical protein PYCCODRAFT_351133 [Trametes coccinea BRFM310]
MVRPERGVRSLCGSKQPFGAFWRPALTGPRRRLRAPEASMWMYEQGAPRIAFIVAALVIVQVFMIIPRTRTMTRRLLCPPCCGVVSILILPRCTLELSVYV